MAIHQDVEPDPNKKDKAKPQGNDICGEAVYLDNKGKGKANARVFHRDPTNPTPIPGPIRWAKVSTDDMIVYGEVLWMDQEQDKIWAFGPGRAEPVDRPRHAERQVARAQARRRCRGRRRDRGHGRRSAAPRVPARPQKGTASSDVRRGPGRPRGTEAPDPRRPRRSATRTCYHHLDPSRMEFNGRTIDTLGPARRPGRLLRHRECRDDRRSAATASRR